ARGPRKAGAGDGNSSKTTVTCFARSGRSRALRLTAHLTAARGGRRAIAVDDGGRWRTESNTGADPKGPSWTPDRQMAFRRSGVRIPSGPPSMLWFSLTPPPQHRVTRAQQRHVDPRSDPYCPCGASFGPASSASSTSSSPVSVRSIAGGRFVHQRRDGEGHADRAVAAIGGATNRTNQRLRLDRCPLQARAVGALGHSRLDSAAQV